MFQFAFPLIGAVGGALLNKKNPLQGALLGGGLGAAGGAIAPALANGGLLAGGQQGAMLAAQNAGLEGATGATNAALGHGGLLGKAGAAMEGFNKATRPISVAADAAASVTPEPAQMPAPQPLQNRQIDMSQYMSGPQDQENERRKQMMQRYAQYAQNGGY